MPTIIEMVNHTRLDCVIGTAAGMRAAVRSGHMARRPPQRIGKRLADQPLMVNVLADLAIESEAATAVALRLARAYDEAAGNPGADAFKRLATAVAKYHVCKRAPGHAFEALECLGGNGYVEASGMPRLYREAPLASIWEGSATSWPSTSCGRWPAARGVRRLLRRDRRGRGRRPAARRLRRRHARGVLRPRGHRAARRRVVERMALCLEGSLLVRHAPQAIADAFCAARLAGDAGLHYGTLPPRVDAAAIVAAAHAATA